MTDTGQVPGEGQPENAGGQPEQPGAPAAGAYAFDAPPTHSGHGAAPTPQGAQEADEDDMLLMPGAQGAWGDPTAAPPVAEQAPGPVSGTHETGGRDSGAFDYGAVRDPAERPRRHAAPRQPQQPRPTATPQRRPLHLGPPVPEQSGAVRSLADRGPAPAPTPPARGASAPAPNPAAPGQRAATPGGPAPSAPTTPSGTAGGGAGAAGDQPGHPGQPGHSDQPGGHPQRPAPAVGADGRTSPETHAGGAPQEQPAAGAAQPVSDGSAQVAPATPQAEDAAVPGPAPDAEAVSPADPAVLAGPQLAQLPEPDLAGQPTPATPVGEHPAAHAAASRRPAAGHPAQPAPAPVEPPAADVPPAGGHGAAVDGPGPAQDTAGPATPGEAAPTAHRAAASVAGGAVVPDQQPVAVEPSGAERPTPVDTPAGAPAPSGEGEVSADTAVPQPGEASPDAGGTPGGDGWTAGGQDTASPPTAGADGGAPVGGAVDAPAADAAMTDATVAATPAEDTTAVVDVAGVERPVADQAPAGPTEATAPAADEPAVPGPAPAAEAAPAVEPGSAPGVTEPTSADLAAREPVVPQPATPGPVTAEAAASGGQAAEADAAGAEAPAGRHRAARGAEPGAAAPAPPPQGPGASAPQAPPADDAAVGTPEQSRQQAGEAVSRTDGSTDPVADSPADEAVGQPGPGEARPTATAATEDAVAVAGDTAPVVTEAASGEPARAEAQQVAPAQEAVAPAQEATEGAPERGGAAETPATSQEQRDHPRQSSAAAQGPAEGVVRKQQPAEASAQAEQTAAATEASAQPEEPVVGEAGEQQPAEGVAPVPQAAEPVAQEEREEPPRPSSGEPSAVADAAAAKSADGAAAGAAASVPGPRTEQHAAVTASAGAAPANEEVEADTARSPQAAERSGSSTAPSASSPAASPAPAPPDAGPAESEREALHRVMRERRDVRQGFRPDPIPDEVLLRVLETAHTAPTVGQSQPWDFVVIRSEETRQTVHELAERQREEYARSLPKGRAKELKQARDQDRAILDAPVNIVVTADPSRHSLAPHARPGTAPYSSVLAVENLLLAAEAEGLGVGWRRFFDEREVVQALGLPEHLEIVAYLCVGYVDAPPEETGTARAGHAKGRPLSWVVHEEAYGRRALPGCEPHDVLAETLAGIRPLDAKALGEAWERQKRMTKPSGSLGMLEIISAQLSGLSRQCPPPIPEPAAVAVFAADHGVHEQRVTAWPQEVTTQMVGNFLRGGAVCNAFAAQVGAEVCVVDVGLAGKPKPGAGLLPRKVRAGTADFSRGPALTRDEALRAVEVGIETARDLVATGNRALLTGEMGVGNTTAAAALIAVFTGADPAEVTGRGTGISDEMHARKIEVVRRGLERHSPDPTDPIGVLAAFGGLEHAAMVGLILGGASLRTPVVLDGVNAGAAALTARALAPEALAACIAGHRSAEPGHVAALQKLGLRPLVDLDLRLGEGTGALLALPVVQSAARAMHEVATFDAAGVTEKS